MTNLDLVNVATIGGVIQFRVFLSMTQRGGVQLITSFLHFLLLILGGLKLIGKR